MIREQDPTVSMKELELGALLRPQHWHHTGSHGIWPSDHGHEYQPSEPQTNYHFMIHCKRNSPLRTSLKWTLAWGINTHFNLPPSHQFVVDCFCFQAIKNLSSFQWELTVQRGRTQEGGRNQLRVFQNPLAIDKLEEDANGKGWQYYRISVLLIMKTKYYINSQVFLEKRATFSFTTSHLSLVEARKPWPDTLTVEHSRWRTSQRPALSNSVISGIWSSKQHFIENKNTRAKENFTL